MALMVQAWDEKKFKLELGKRLKSAKRAREKWESQWKTNERTCFYFNGRSPGAVTLTEDNLIRFDQGEDSEGSVEQVDMAVNYCWKFLRFIHSQMSANPPSVIARPTSPDSDDRLKADAADRVVRFAFAQYNMQEIFDQTNLKCLTYGTSFVRVWYNANGGEALEFDKKTGELTMTGEIETYSPSTWDIYLDPTAKVFEGPNGVRYYFERCEMPFDDALFMWPEYKDQLEQAIKKKNKTESELRQEDDGMDDVVEIFYYTERGLQVNGMAGRMASCLEDGTLLGKPTENTNPDRGLGLAIETDIDLPDQVYGMSFIQYIYKLQDLLNRLDTSFVDNIAAHNVVRMVLPDGAELEDESLSNSAWDYVHITGNAGNAPYFVNPPSLMPDAHKLRENLISGIQELAGVNDSMMGVQKREMSGFSMQTAIDAGNQTRRRLFNKYTLCVKNVFVMWLGNAVKYWDTPQAIKCLGKEKAFEVSDLKGADIADGYDVTCEYGASLSLDPARRREEIMQLMPVFEKAGVPTKTILSMLKLNELDGLYDRMQLAADRQREIFETMIAENKPIDPREMEDHAGMLDYAYYFVMTATYKYLPDELKEMIDAHIKSREQFAAQAATKGQGAAPAAPDTPQQGASLPGGALPKDVLTQGNAAQAPLAAPAAA